MALCTLPLAGLGAAIPRQDLHSCWVWVEQGQALVFCSCPAPFLGNLDKKATINSQSFECGVSCWKETSDDISVPGMLEDLPSPGSFWKDRPWDTTGSFPLAH